MNIVVIATLVGIAEVFMILYSGFRLVGFKPEPRRLFLVSLLVAFLLRGARYLLYGVMGLPFGIHILAALTALFLGGLFGLRAPPLMAAVAVALGYMILLLGTLLGLLFTPNIDPNNPVTILRMIAIEEGPLTVMTLFIWKTGITLVPGHFIRSLRG